MSIKDSWRHLVFRVRHSLWGADNVVLVLAVIVCLAMACNSIAATTRNWELSENLTKERQRLELVSVEVEAQELENEYYQTEEYQELMARSLLDKKLPGENMVVMPENSEAAKTKHQEVEVEPVQKEYSNFEKWMMRLFPS